MNEAEKQILKQIKDNRNYRSNSQEERELINKLINQNYLKGENTTSFGISPRWDCLELTEKGYEYLTQNTLEELNKNSCIQRITKFIDKGYKNPCAQRITKFIDEEYESPWKNSLNSLNNLHKDIINKNLTWKTTIRKELIMPIIASIIAGIILLIVSIIFLTPA